MVAHSEEDLLCIRAAYLKLTGTSLYSALQVGHTSSCLKHLMKNNEFFLHGMVLFIVLLKLLKCSDFYVGTLSNRNSTKEIIYKLCWPSVDPKTEQKATPWSRLLVLMLVFPSWTSHKINDFSHTSSFFWCLPIYLNIIIFPMMLINTTSLEQSLSFLSFQRLH